MDGKKMRVLLIDDDINLCKVIGYQLQKAGYEVETAFRGKEGLEKFKEGSFEVVLSDIQMPDLSGIQVLEEIRRLDQNVVVIMITAYGSVENALKACHLGANDYLTKPFSIEQLLFVIKKATKLQELQEENLELKQELVEKHRFGNLIARSSKMEEVLKMAMKVARSDSTVLILGESGTGKELLARAIHFNSPRKDGPFITVNCPSIPDNLLESELFGHVKGAFTGALRDRKGKFLQADGGTLFLDEIGDLRLDLQAKVLRALQEREIEPVGGEKLIKINVRVIAATHQNLEERIHDGRFREDLYYRLSVVPITLPPLRERKEEIPYLVDYFVQKYGRGQKYEIDPLIYEYLKAYDWPGNIRELENVVERAVVLATDNKINLESLPPNLLHTTSSVRTPNGPDVLALEDLSLENIERQAIQKALEKSEGNRSKAARILKIPRHVLLYRMKKLGLE